MATLTRLGGVFASVMTGNLAPMGLGLAKDDVTSILHTVMAVISYAAGVAVGSRIIGVRDPDHPVWPPRVTAALGVQLVVQCALTAGWVAARGDPTGVLQLALLTAAAASMGLQGAAVRGLGVPLATTYLTGTLTALVVNRTTASRARSDAAGLAAVIAAVVGAVCGGLMLKTAPTVAPVLCVLPVVAVVGTAEWHRRHVVHHATR